MAIDVTSRLGVSPDTIAEFCRRWKITDISLFGSIVRDDFGPKSDVDLLITFAPDSHWSLLDHVTMEDEMKDILGRPVDMIERQAVESSENYIRRRHILNPLLSVSRPDDALLLDILIAARRAISFLEGVSRAEFGQSDLLRSALLRNLSIIGVAAGKISHQTKSAHPEIAWEMVKHVPPGSRLWPHYTPDRVWETVKHVLPALLAAIEPLVPPDEVDA